MRQQGFTYVGLLLLLALAGTALAGAGTLWSIESRRDKEAELLFIGDQFNDAITSFREHTPAGQVQRFPRRLDELLDDKRWPATRRHLRQVFVDPMTGSREWGLVRTPGGEIMGVHSLAEQRPLKKGNFPGRWATFAQADSYRGWRFVYSETPGGGDSSN
jgi:type II secretory pathway pseudopilin PulG